MKKIIFISILTCLSLVISLFENIIPIPIPVPGVKLGLSNIVILVTLVNIGFKESLIVSTLKSILLVLVTGSVASFPYSFISSIFSSTTMAVAYKFFNNRLSLIGVSEIGAFSFNVGQILVASIVLNNFKIFTYLPLITFSGIFTGYFVGISSMYISDKLFKVMKNGERNL